MTTLTAKKLHALAAIQDRIDELEALKKDMPPAVMYRLGNYCVQSLPAAEALQILNILLAYEQRQLMSIYDSTDAG